MDRATVEDCLQKEEARSRFVRVKSQFVYKTTDTFCDDWKFRGPILFCDDWKFRGVI